MGYLEKGDGAVKGGELSTFRRNFYGKALNAIFKKYDIELSGDLGLLKKYLLEVAGNVYANKGNGNQHNINALNGILNDIFMGYDMDMSSDLAHMEEDISEFFEVVASDGYTAGIKQTPLPGKRESDDLLGDLKKDI